MDLLIIGVVIFAILGTLGWHLRSNFDNNDKVQLLKHLVLGVLTAVLVYSFILVPAELSDTMIIGASAVAGYFNTEILDIVLEKGVKFIK